MEFIETDFGPVRLTPKTVNYFDTSYPDWREVLTNKRRRGKRAQYIREEVRRLESAVCFIAGIEWVAGGILREF